MAKLAFLLLAHRDPDRLLAQTQALTAHGDYVVIHWDKRSSKSWNKVRDGLKGNPNVAFASRVRCGWGEYSLIQASLNLIRKAKQSFADITHYYLISGDCYPTKTRAFFDNYLADGKDIIEVKDFFQSDWIRTGIKEDRLIYRHYFNERSRKWLFYTSLNLQRRFGLARPLPKDLSIRIGSQWWVLRAETIDRLLELLDRRRDITKFFSTTWIPDETFFQTVVSHLVPDEQIKSHPPTHLLFSDYGMPVVFHQDHADYLQRQPRMFARKISANANGLQKTLLDHFVSGKADQPSGNGELKLYQYLSDRGRKGQRYAPRFWETAINPRKRAELLIVVAKLWHIGEAIQKKASDLISSASLGYVFDDTADIDLPLGNLERGLGKRGRHRVALMNLMYDAMRTERLIICLDPSRTEALREFIEKIGDVRILLVDRPVSQAHIRSHALRSNLFAEDSGEFEQIEVMRALTHEFENEISYLREHFADRLYINDLGRTREQNVLDIGHFLRVPRSGAEALAREAEKYRQ
ncbi:MAG: DUF5928 domain-containing protein [Pseudomonadota bacterium]